jgi:hypothetical protein
MLKGMGGGESGAVMRELLAEMKAQRAWKAATATSRRSRADQAERPR